MGLSLAALTVHLPTATVTTIILSLGLSGLGFFAGGYYAGHATLSDDTSAGVRRIWIAVFALIGLTGILFAMHKLLFTPLTSGQYADPGEVTLIVAISAALGLTVTFVATVGLHERFARGTAWTVAMLPATAFAIAEILVVRETLRPAGAAQGPNYALFYLGAYEIVAVLFMLFVVYGPRALGARDPNALLMLTGLVLFLVAPLIYTLGSPNGASDALIDPTGWFIACHLAGMFFTFLAALPSEVPAIATRPVVVDASERLPLPMTPPAPRFIERDESATGYGRTASSVRAVAR
jgi:energy-converting hydrogenase Eha subunit B